MTGNTYKQKFSQKRVDTVLEVTTKLSDKAYARGVDAGSTIRSSRLFEDWTERCTSLELQWLIDNAPTFDRYNTLRERAAYLMKKRGDGIAPKPLPGQVTELVL